jgi:hypothetical protein
MSETALIAILSLLGSIFVASVTAWATVAAAGRPFPAILKFLSAATFVGVIILVFHLITGSSTAQNDPRDTIPTTLATSVSTPLIPGETIQILTPTPLLPPTSPPSTLIEETPAFFMVRIVSMGDLSGNSCQELDFMRNEIYARYGSIFQREDLRTYFSQQDWYQPRIEQDDMFEERYFDEIQRNNVEIIKYFQCELGCAEVNCVQPSQIYDSWKQNQ